MVRNMKVAILMTRSTAGAATPGLMENDTLDGGSRESSMDWASTLWSMALFSLVSGTTERKSRFLQKKKLGKLMFS